MFTLCALVAFLFSFSARAEIHLDQIKLPPGFHVSIFKDKVTNARSMTFGKKGTLFVGTREAGNVYAIDKKRHLFLLAKDLNEPNGVAFKDGDLYVAEINRVIKFKNIESNLEHPPKPVVVVGNYPTDHQHGWKFIAFAPDGKLYVPVGANCNICEPKDPYASITRFEVGVKNPENSQEIFARGIRNTVGFDWNPVTHELWFTDNGRDMLGDDLPSDELNHAPKSGMHFGYPYCHQGDTLDPEFGKGKKCADYTAPDEKLGAHVAALGMRFYSGNMFPKEYFQQIFIAEHGSWNRTIPVGYRVAVAKFDSSSRNPKSEIFAEGWLQNGKAWGRPVDVITAPDGALLVSDDFADVIYRISYEN